VPRAALVTICFMKLSKTATVLLILLAAALACVPVYLFLRGKLSGKSGKKDGDHPSEHDEALVRRVQSMLNNDLYDI